MKKIIVCVLLFIVVYQPIKPLSMASFKTKNIQVEIKGEVAKPGVYTLPKEATLSTLIDKAKGYTKEADTDLYNRNQDIFDKDVIVITKKTTQEKISINGGSLQQLQSIPGIGPSTAKKIVDYRTSQGSFQNLEEIMNVKGIKEKLFEKMKAYISL